MSKKQQPTKPPKGNAKGSVPKPKRRRRQKGMCLEDRPVLEPNAAGVDVGARAGDPPGWRGKAGRNLRSSRGLVILG